MIRTSISIALLLVIAACGGASGEQPSPTPIPQTPVILPSATPTTVPAPSAIDLEQALIDRDDLDRRWYGSSAAFPIFTPADMCAPQAPFVSYGPLAANTRTLSQSEGGPWLTEMLLLYPDLQTASEAFGALRESFECNQWTQLTAPLPLQVPTATVPSPTGSPAPESAATAPTEPPAPIWDAVAPSDLDYRAESFLAGLSSRTQPRIETEYVAVRENNLILVIAHWSALDIDTEITMSFVDLALERFDAAFGSS